MAEEIVAPLDAYATAKPDEPTFTLQGGDPLAAPLVRIWAQAARVRAGALKSDTINYTLSLDGIGESIEHDEKERDNLLVRATAAEEVSWSMDEYRKHGHATDKPTEAKDTHLDELQRIDLHDLRVRIASRLSNFRCELVEMRQALIKAGFTDYLGDFLNAENHLNAANEVVEPRRLFKKD